MDTSEKHEDESLTTCDSEDLIDIHYAIVEDDKEKLNELCKQSGRNLNGRFMDDLNAQHVNMTPLALAAALDKIDLVKILLKNGADVDATFANLKTTALMTSSFHGHESVVKLLLDHGANVRKSDVQKSTALGYCFGGSRSAPVVALLINDGIDVNISNVLGMNAFLLVSGYGNEDLLQMVIQAGAKVKEAANNFGHTPLHLAVLGKQSQIDAITSRGYYSTAHYGLNRRNMKSILLDWATQNRDGLLNGCMLDGTFEKTGQFLEDLGARMVSLYTRITDEELLSEEEVMKHKVDVAAKYRAEKLTTAISIKKSGLIDSILSCGGKLGKHGKEVTHQASNIPSIRPTVEQSVNLPDDKEQEIQLICNKFAKCLRILLDAGCQVDEPEHTFGLTALDIAILNGDTESIAVLLSSGADHNHLLKVLSMTDLYMYLASERPDKKQIKDLMDHDPHLDVNASFENANIPTRLSESENDDMLGDVGLTPLAVASKVPDNSTTEIIKLLIKHGANPNHAGKGGRTTLGETCRWGNIKMVDFLISQGADMEQPNPAFKNATPLGIAVLEKQPRIVQSLISKGAIVDRVMSDGRTSLINAIDAEDMPMVEMLLQSNPNTNFSNKGGFDHQIAQDYQSADKDIRLILQSISNKASKLKEEEENAKRGDEEKLALKLHAEKLRPNLSLSGDYSYDEFGKMSGIYEEIKTGPDNITNAVVVPKFRKKKKKIVERSENPYEVIGGPQIKPRISKVNQELPPISGDSEPIYSQVKEKKTPLVGENVLGSVKTMAVGMLEQNTEKISEVIATGVSKVVGQDKKQTIKSVAQPVIRTAVGFARKSNQPQVAYVDDDPPQDSGQDGATSDVFSGGTRIVLNGDDGNAKIAKDLNDPKWNVNILDDVDIENEIIEAMKGANIGKQADEERTIISEVKTEIVPVKRKKKTVNKEKTENDEGDQIEIKPNVEIPQTSFDLEVTSPVSIDNIDNVIFKPKARRRRTKPSTESSDDAGLEQKDPEEINYKSQSNESNLSEAVDHIETSANEIGQIVPEVRSRKKKKVKTPVSTDE